MVWSLAWSPDGKRALTAGHDGLVRLWRSEGAVEPLHPDVILFPEAPEEPAHADFSNSSNASIVEIGGIQISLVIDNIDADALLANETLKAAVEGQIQDGIV